MRYPTDRPAIEIDYNDIDDNGLTYFRFRDVETDRKLMLGEEVICHQPEDETFTTGIVEYLNPVTFAGKVRVHWSNMQEYFPHQL